MKQETIETTVEIMGKTYQIKCLEQDKESLQEAAYFLEQKMCYTRDVHKVLSIDRIAVITALNITHQLLTTENQTQSKEQSFQQRLRELSNKLESALARYAQMELNSAE